MAKLVDATGLGPVESNLVEVRVLSVAPSVGMIAVFLKYSEPILCGDFLCLLLLQGEKSLTSGGFFGTQSNFISRRKHADKVLGGVRVIWICHNSNGCGVNGIGASL